jgi:hypothetical protein
MVMKIERLGLAKHWLMMLMSFMFFFQACDRGSSYYPKAWVAQREGREWVKSLEGVELRTRGISGLLGSDSISPEFIIANRTSASLIIKSATLRAQRFSYPARLPGQGEAKWRTVPPGGTLRIPLFWSLPKPFSEILGEEPEIALDVQQGAVRRTIEIVYARSR